MFESLLETLKSYSLVGPILVAAPIAIFIAFYFNWWRNRKSLSYEVLTSTNLFSVNSEVKHRIKITLDGKPAKDVQIVIIELLNDGYLPIEDKDFSTPLTIDFGESAEIISVENKENNPEDLPVKIISEKTKVEIEPLLLNRKDSLKMQILVNKFENNLYISARIKGILKIRNKKIPINFFDYLLYKRFPYFDPDLFFPFFMTLVFWILALVLPGSFNILLVIASFFTVITFLLFLLEFKAYRKARKMK